MSRASQQPGHRRTAALVSAGLTAVTLTALAAHAVAASGGVPSWRVGTGTEVLTAANRSPDGRIDRLAVAGGNLVASGWAADRDTPHTPVRVTVTLDGRPVLGPAATAGARPDVARVTGMGPNAGYQATFAAVDGPHSVCLNAADTTTGRSFQVRCAGITMYPKPRGAMNGFGQNGGSVTVSGWARDDGTPAPVWIESFVDGRLAARVAANRPNSAISRSEGTSRGLAFAAGFGVPVGRHQVCSYAMNPNAGGSDTVLRCVAITVAAPPPAPALDVTTQVAMAAKRYVGARYVDGGATPAGFDCSGLVMYLYANVAHKNLPHFAQTQFQLARPIPQSQARPGDVVFFHDGSGYVFHDAIYEGNNMIVSAATPQDGVRYQAIWSTAVTFGTYTH